VGCHDDSNNKEETRDEAVVQRVNQNVTPDRRTAIKPPSNRHQTAIKPPFNRNQIASESKRADMNSADSLRTLAPLWPFDLLRSSDVAKRRRAKRKSALTVVDARRR